MGFVLSIFEFNALCNLNTKFPPGQRHGCNGPAVLHLMFREWILSKVDRSIGVKANATDIDPADRKVVRASRLEHQMVSSDG